MTRFSLSLQQLDWLCVSVQKIHEKFIPRYFRFVLSKLTHSGENFVKWKLRDSSPQVMVIGAEKSADIHDFDCYQYLPNHEYIEIIWYCPAQSCSFTNPPPPRK